MPMQPCQLQQVLKSWQATTAPAPDGMLLTPGQLHLYSQAACSRHYRADHVPAAAASEVSTVHTYVRSMHPTQEWALLCEANQPQSQVCSS